MIRILDQVARIGNGQVLVQSFAGRPVPGPPCAGQLASAITGPSRRVACRRPAGAAASCAVAPPAAAGQVLNAGMPVPATVVRTVRNTGPVFAHAWNGK